MQEKIKVTLDEQIKTHLTLSSSSSRPVPDLTSDTQSVHPAMTFRCHFVLSFSFVLGLSAHTPDLYVLAIAE